MCLSFRCYTFFGKWNYFDKHILNWSFVSVKLNHFVTLDLTYIHLLYVLHYHIYYNILYNIITYNYNIYYKHIFHVYYIYTFYIHIHKWINGFLFLTSKFQIFITLWHYWNSPKNCIFNLQQSLLMHILHILHIIISVLHSATISLSLSVSVSVCLPKHCKSLYKTRLVERSKLATSAINLPDTCRLFMHLLLTFCCCCYNNNYFCCNATNS